MLRRSNVLASNNAAGTNMKKSGSLTAYVASGKSIKGDGRMAILRRSGSIFLMSVATAVTISLSAGPAFAATKWTVKPGGPITAKSKTTTLTDTSSGTKLSCKSSKARGRLKRGSGLSGRHIGRINSLRFTSCSGPLGLTFTVKGSNFPWRLNAKSFKAGVTKGTITGIHAKLAGTGCTAIVDGTGASKDNGRVKVTYTNRTHALKVRTGGGNLHIYRVHGCAGLIHSGDASTFSAKYKVSPNQRIHT